MDLRNIRKLPLTTEEQQSPDVALPAQVPIQVRQQFPDSIYDDVENDNLPVTSGKAFSPDSGGWKRSSPDGPDYDDVENDDLPGGWRKGFPDSRPEKPQSSVPRSKIEESFYEIPLERPPWSKTEESFYEIPLKRLPRECKSNVTKSPISTKYDADSFPTVPKIITRSEMDSHKQRPSEDSDYDDIEIDNFRTKFRKDLTSSGGEKLKPLVATSNAGESTYEIPIKREWTAGVTRGTGNWSMEPETDNRLKYYTIDEQMSPAPNDMYMVFDPPSRHQSIERRAEVAGSVWKQGPPSLPPRNNAQNENEVKTVTEKRSVLPYILVASLVAISLIITGGVIYSQMTNSAELDITQSTSEEVSKTVLVSTLQRISTPTSTTSPKILRGSTGAVTTSATVATAMAVTTPEATSIAVTTTEATSTAVTTTEATSIAITTPDATSMAAIAPEATSIAVTTTEATYMAVTKQRSGILTDKFSYGNVHFRLVMIQYGEISGGIAEDICSSHDKEVAWISQENAYSLVQERIRLRVPVEWGKCTIWTAIRYDPETGTLYTNNGTAPYQNWFDRYPTSRKTDTQVVLQLYSNQLSGMINVDPSYHACGVLCR